MTCTKHNIPDNNQDGLDIEKCLRCLGEGFTKHNLFGARGEVEHLIQFVRANKIRHNINSKLMVGKFCEPCNGSGLGEKVKKVWWEDCGRCDGVGYVAWGIEDKVCWACGGAKKRAFKTSPEARAKRRETARRKAEERDALRAEKELARQREITGGLTFAEKQAEREAQWAKEKAQSPDVPDSGKDRITISGTVLKVDIYESRFGASWKMTVKDDRGFVVFGSVPNTKNGVMDCAKGDHLTFIATVAPSNKDSKFGFFKRPSLTESTPWSDEKRKGTHNREFIKECMPRDRMSRTIVVEG